MGTKLFYNRDPNGKQLRNRLTPMAIGSIAERNRHTGKPHEHKREIVRNTGA